MPLPLYARGEFERDEDVTTTAVLLLASTKSRWNALALFLEKHAPTREAVNFTLYSDGRKLLHVAAATGNLSHVRLLSEGAYREPVSRASTINERQKDGLTPLHVACRDGKVPMIKGLLRLGGDLSVKDEHGRTPFWYACQHGQVEIVRRLVSHPKAKHFVNEADNDGNSPLHAACLSLRVEVVQLLVEHGEANINAENKARATPLLATLTRSDWDFQGPVVRVAVVLVENFAKVPTEAEINKHGSQLSPEKQVALVACCEYWKKAGFLNADIPYNVLTRGAAAVQEFSACSVENFRRHRVCLVGQTEFGKTSLVKTIVNRVPSKTHYFVRTIGIELTSWTFRDENGMFHQVTLWDFAGQDIYKPAHAPFFSEKTLFMLCIDMYAYKSKINQAMTLHHGLRTKILKHIAEANVLCWLRLIFSRQPKARVVLVGTKSDLVEMKEIPSVWNEINAQIQRWKSAFVQDTDVDTKEALSCEEQTISHHLESFVCQETLVVNSAKPEVIGPMIAKVQKIVAASEVNSPLLSDVIDVLREVYRRRREASKKTDEERVYELIVPCTDITSNIEALEELHNLGDILLLRNISNETYNDYAILEPKLIVDFIRQVVSHELVDPNDAGKDTRALEALKLIREEGKVAHSFLTQLPLWRDCDDDLVVVLKTLLHRFQLVYPDYDVDMTSDPDIIVPLLWHPDGEGNLPPLSKEIALTTLKPLQEKTYPTHLRWEYELKQGIPPTLFTHLAVASHAVNFKRNIHGGCIDAQDKEGKCFLSRISIPMDKELKLRSHIVRLEVIAFDVREAWVKLKFFICAMERVLEKYPGLTPGRYVEVLPGGKRYNVNMDLAKMKKKQETNGGARDETELEWLPPLTVGIDWFVNKYWSETDQAKTMMKLDEVKKSLDLLREVGEHSESYLRAMLKLSLQPERHRKYPGLWTLEMVQPEQGNPIVRIWFYSDLTGDCHQKEPLEFRIPDAPLSKYGAYIKFGMSIVSNLVPSALDFGVLKTVVDKVKRVVDERVDQAIQIHNLIANFDFVEQTGDQRVLSAAHQASNGETTVAAVGGLDRDQAVDLLEQLLQLTSMNRNPEDYISSVSGLIRGCTISQTHVWASKQELEKHQGVLEVYEGKSSTSIPQPVLQKCDQHGPNPTAKFTIEIAVVCVPQAFQKSDKIWMTISVKEREILTRKMKLMPASDGKTADWRGCSAMHSVKESTIDHIRKCELELQPYKAWVWGLRRKVAKPIGFKFSETCEMGDVIKWKVDWNNGKAAENLELKVHLLATDQHQP